MVKTETMCNLIAATRTVLSQLLKCSTKYSTKHPLLRKSRLIIFLISRVYFGDDSPVFIQLVIVNMVYNKLLVFI